jgi:hypothetical protein
MISAFYGIFSLIVKASLIFGKRFTIYDFQNRKSFSEFKVFVLVPTFVGIYHRYASEFVGDSNIPPKVPNFGI